jgi:hypothetical protein
MSGPAGEQATRAETKLVSVKMSRPSRTSQKRTGLRRPATASPFPSWENATETLKSEPFVKMFFTSPVAACSSFTVRSELAAAIRPPSGDHAMSMTWPLMG